MPLHRLALAAILVSCTLPLLGEEKVQPQTKAENDQTETNQASRERSAIEDRQKRLNAAIATFDELIHREPPSDLDPRQLAEWNDQTFWLESVRNRYRKLASAYSSAPQGSPAIAVKKLDLESMAVQNVIQTESRKYKLVSQMCKIRHDIATAAIQNARQ